MISMEEKHNEPYKSPQKSFQSLSCFQKQTFSYQRNTLSLIRDFKDKPKRIKWDKSSNLEIYLAEKILSDIRNLENISSVKSSYFNNLNLSNQFQISRHFKQIMSEDDKQSFYKIMLLSRELEEIYLASSNAATILNKVGFSFDNQNLQNIKIPYADLSKNSFIRTDFSNSDLKYVDFTSSLVAFSNFSNCKMSESKLEKTIFEPKDWEKVEKVTISKCEKYAASLNSMKNKTDSCCILIFSVEQSIEINSLQLSNYRMVHDLKFSSDSSILYILYGKDDLAVWNFIENRYKVIKLENKISSFLLTFTETMLAYSVPGFIKAISLITFESIFQLNTGKELNYQVKSISDKYLVSQKRDSSTHKIWYIEFEMKCEKIRADFIDLCGDTYIKIYNGVLEIIKIKSNESIWKIRDAGYKYTKLHIAVSHGEEDVNKNFGRFSPCGNYLATASTYNIIIWESATGIKIAKAGGLLLEIQKFCYSQCGKYIASYIEGNLILIWNAEAGLKQFKAGNRIDLDINLSLDRAIISDATIFSGNNFSGVSYINEDKDFKY